MVNYHTESHVEHHRDRFTTVENVYPSYRPEERQRVRRDIEDRLFDVFRKYVGHISVS